MCVFSMSKMFVYKHTDIVNVKKIVAFKKNTKFKGK